MEYLEHAIPLNSRQFLWKCHKGIVAVYGVLRTWHSPELQCLPRLGIYFKHD